MAVRIAGSATACRRPHGVWTLNSGQSLVVADVTCPHCGGNLAEGMHVWLVPGPGYWELEPTSANGSG